MANSKTYVTTIPPIITKLHNLQTLRLNRSQHVKKFPKDFEKLTKLRHLRMDSRLSLYEMPKNIGKLSCLQTLSSFTVSTNRGMRIDELGRLKKLRGKLGIYRLGKVRDGEEAKKAELREKTKLKKLDLVWERRVACFENNKQVLEGLQPHRNLKSLGIWNYKGDGFPSWVMEMDNLVEIRLMKCSECEQVPMLGHLPYLQVLEISGLEKVKCIGGVSDEFYGRMGTAFPSLKKMCLGKMRGLVEWNDVACISTRLVNAFPCLEVLAVSECPELETFPSHSSIDFPSMRKLEIEGIKSGGHLGEILYKVTSLEQLTIKDVEKGLESIALVEICRNNKNLTSVYIKDIGELESTGDSAISSVAAAQSSKALLSLTVFRCQKLRYMDVKSLTGLRRLNITYCDSLEYITRSNYNGLTSLEFLQIEYCPRLIHLPDLRACLALSHVGIIGCEKVSSISGDQLGCLPRLVELELGKFGGELEHFPGFGGEQQQQLFMSLETTLLIGWGSKPESLPDQLQYATQLKTLQIRCCDGLNELPDWIGNLSSLRRLELYKCSNLTSLEVTTRLTNLGYLEVHYCAELVKRYKNQVGRAWLKQANINSNLM